MLRTLSAKNGLPCDAVHWSEEDADHSVWLYLECGLVRVVPSEMSAWAADPNRTVRVTLLDSSDGVDGQVGYLRRLRARLSQSPWMGNSGSVSKMASMSSIRVTCFQQTSASGTH